MQSSHPRAVQLKMNQLEHPSSRLSTLHSSIRRIFHIPFNDPGALNFSHYRSMLALQIAWMLFAVIIMFQFSGDPPESLKSVESRKTALFLMNALLWAPIIENTVMIVLLNFLRDLADDRYIAFWVAIAAAFVHMFATWRGLYAFGGFFLMAAYYLTISRRSKTEAFLFCLFMHVFSNTPASIAMLLLDRLE